ncbi:ATP-binding protein [Actinoplanes rectilineatus]|uniref:ATP-binding protein n=1 Tax=Actinoplanes rectilineatus TaxID=113571 RepID=UPI0005F2CC33|nr:ATP-binding protein [Actinoplanes rectilineatus]
MTALTVATLTLDAGGPREAIVQVSALTGGRTLVAVGPDGASYPELRDRVYAGITNSGLSWPDRNIIISFAPLGLWPVHPSSDLAVAAAVLAAAGHIQFTALSEAMFFGEVGLDGAVRPVPETLALVAAAAEREYRTVVVPAANARQAMLVPGVRVIGVNTLSELLTWATVGTEPAPPGPGQDHAMGTAGQAEPDLPPLPAWMQPTRFALEVAAAGRHHLGVTAAPELPVRLIGQYLRSLVPDLDDRHAVEVSALHAAAGYPVDALIRRPPLQVSGPKTSVTSMLGGKRPGLVSLAHRGVLLLHNAPDFAPEVLHALRQPLDRRIVQLARARGTTTVAADVQLIVTSRPCPCPATHSTSSGCSTPERRRYRNQLRAISDRLDIVAIIEATAGEATAGESTATLTARVVAARAAAAARWAPEGFSTNAEITKDVLRRPSFRIPASATEPLRRLLDAGQLSVQAYGRVLRLAWTVSDLRGARSPDRDAVDSAIELYNPRRYTS